MRESRLSDEQIIQLLLQEVESGDTIRYLCREHRIAERTYLPVESQVWRNGRLRDPSSQEA